jgi:hypothetical protein
LAAAPLIETPEPGPAKREQPVLWLGLAGFDPVQRSTLQGFLDRAPGLPEWRICGFGEADAWLLNGAKCRVVTGGNLKVSAGTPSEKSVTLDLSDASRPVAFGTPLASDELEPLIAFDLASGPSVEGMLLQLDEALRLERVQFVLGSKIVRLGAKLRHGTFHLSREGEPLAVLDFRKGEAYLSPRLHPEDVQQAAWTKRSIDPDAVPPEFLVYSTSRLSWAYVRRTERDMLPARYRQLPIYFRRAPRVPLRLLDNSQLTLLHELATGPSTRDALAERTGLEHEKVDRALACLYYAGCITTSPGKAAQPSENRDRQRDSSTAALLSEDMVSTYVER